MFSATEVFDIAIQLEENGERLYRMAAEQVDDDALRQMLDWLAEEEVRHRARFVEMKRSTNILRVNEKWADEASGAILQSVIGDRAFSLDDLDPRNLKNEAELMRIAIEFEEDGILFYEMIRSFVSEPVALLQLNAILDEERQHVEMFKKRMARDHFLAESDITSQSTAK
jgi:rubrerythrin